MNFRKKRLYCANQKCRSYCFSFSIGSAVRKAETFTRFGKIQIQIKTLHVHQFFWSRCQLNPLISQEVSVHLCQYSTGLRIFGNASFIDPDKKQCPNIFQSCSLHISDQNLIDSRRNQRNFRLRHTSLQKLSELFRRNYFFTKNTHHLIQKIHDNPVNLCIFFLHSTISLLFKMQFLHFQFFLNLSLHNKIIQISAVFSDRFLFSGKSFCQFTYFLCKMFTNFIQIHDDRRIHATVDSYPCLIPFAKSTDSKCDHIIFQDIHFSS